ncbi:MAG: ABC transporter ATP-binding protein [Streptosporangiaceae bacterium]
MTEASPIIEAREIVKSFGPTPALRGASVQAKQGEILAVMGPSGSGKSTLLHCLAGILTPDRGEVWFRGQRLDTMREGPRSELRRDRFGFVFQSGQLVPELTAEENVALPLFIATVAVVAITTQNAKDLTRWGSAAEANVLTAQVSASNQVAGNSDLGASEGTAVPGPAAPAAPLTAQLSGIPGVHGCSWSARTRG